MIKGLWTAIVTPFKDGELDEKGLRENLRFQKEHGVDGIAAIGTTGEAPTLSLEERDRILALCKESHLPLMAGTGTNCTRTTIALTRRAADSGVDFALVVTPYYNKPSQEGICRHFLAVADASEIPIVLYNHPGRTGVGMTIETLKRLAAHDNIVGIKEASGSLDLTAELVRDNPDFRVLSGDDKLTYPLMSLGAHGVVSVSSNLIPHLMRQLVYSNEARERHLELLDFFEATAIESNPIPIKAMMRMAGMAAGDCRLPLTGLQPENERRIQWLFETLTSRL